MTKISIRKFKSYVLCFDLTRSITYICWIEMLFMYTFTVVLFSEYGTKELLEKTTLKRVFLVFASEQIIKGFTCISLFIGTTMKNHKLLQPWLVIEILEIIVGTMMLAMMVIYTVVYRPFVIAIFPLILVIGMKIYYIKCVISLHTTLKSMNPSRTEVTMEEGRSNEPTIPEILPEN